MVAGRQDRHHHRTYMYSKRPVGEMKSRSWLTSILGTTEEEKGRGSNANRIVLKYRSSGLFGYFVQGSLPSTIIFAIRIKIFFNMIILMSSFAISFTIYYLGTIIFFFTFRKDQVVRNLFCNCLMQNSCGTMSHISLRKMQICCTAHTTTTTLLVLVIESLRVIVYVFSAAYIILQHAYISLQQFVELYTYIHIILKCLQSGRGINQ